MRSMELRKKSTLTRTMTADSETERLYYNKLTDASWDNAQIEFAHRSQLEQSEAIHDCASSIS